MGGWGGEGSVAAIGVERQLSFLLLAVLPEVNRSCQLLPVHGGGVRGLSEDLLETPGAAGRWAAARTRRGVV